MAFATYEIYNLLAEKVIATLAADTVLASGGALEVKLWEQEFRDDAASFSDNELPAVSAAVVHSGGEVVEWKSGWHTAEFTAQILVTAAGNFSSAGTYATPDAASIKARQIANRIERLCRQQNVLSKQFTAAPDALEGGIAKTLKVLSVTTTAFGGEVEGTNILRGAALIVVEFSVNFNPVID